MWALYMRNPKTEAWLTRSQAWPRSQSSFVDGSTKVLRSFLSIPRLPPPEMLEGKVREVRPSASEATESCRDRGRHRHYISQPKNKKQKTKLFQRPTAPVGSAEHRQLRPTRRCLQQSLVGTRHHLNTTCTALPGDSIGFHLACKVQATSNVRACLAFGGLNSRWWFASPCSPCIPRSLSMP